MTTHRSSLPPFLGYIFFQQIPDGWSVMGYILICGAGIGMFLYNRHRDHRAVQ